MPRASHAELVGPAHLSIQASSLQPEQKDKSLKLLVEAAFNLDAARLGRTLYENATTGDQTALRLFDENWQATQLASEHLVSRCLATALDLCAGSLYWMVRSTPLYPRSPDREADLNTWNGPELQAALRQDPKLAPLDAWLSDVRGDECRLLLDWRHGSTHRWVRRDITINLGSSPAHIPTQVIIRGRSHSLTDLIVSLTTFADDQFTRFIGAVSTSFPQAPRLANG